jgi:hypothetical protein
MAKLFLYSFAELSDKNLLVTDLLLLVVRSGTNCVGAPCGNDMNAFFNSTYFGGYFTSTGNEGQPYDFSNGVIGSVVPEPSTVALFTYGVGALLIALRRRRFYSTPR